MILSIDVGICNLSYCLLTSLGYIVDWGIIDLSSGENSKNIDLITVGRNLRFSFREHFFDIIDSIKTVIIENQLGSYAIRMRSVQHMIMQYWLCMGISDVQFISPKLKLKNFDCAKETYAQRKKSSIMITENLIQNDEICCEKMREIFRRSIKKDDLADAFLQVNYYVKHCI